MEIIMEKPTCEKVDVFNFMKVRDYMDSLRPGWGSRIWKILCDQSSFGNDRYFKYWFYDDDDDYVCFTNYINRNNLKNLESENRSRQMQINTLVLTKQPIPENLQREMTVEDCHGYVDPKVLIEDIQKFREEFYLLDDAFVVFWICW
jgi:hypothetical protein